MLKCKRRVVGFTAVAKKRSSRVLLLFGGEEWRSCIVVVRSQVDYKELSRLNVSSCQWRLKFTSR